MRRSVAALLGAIVIAGGMVATTGTALAAVPYCGPYAHWVRHVGCVPNRTVFVPRYYHPRPHYHYYAPRRRYPLAQRPVFHHGPVVHPLRRNHA
jgi:hypothetical protein